MLLITLTFRQKSVMERIAKIQSIVAIGFKLTASKNSGNKWKNTAKQSNKPNQLFRIFCIILSRNAFKIDMWLLTHWFCDMYWLSTCWLFNCREHIRCSKEKAKKKPQKLNIALSRSDRMVIQLTTKNAFRNQKKN